MQDFGMAAFLHFFTTILFSFKVFKARKKNFIFLLKYGPFGSLVDNIFGYPEHQTISGKKTLSKKLCQSGQEIDFSRYPYFGANFLTRFFSLSRECWNFWFWDRCCSTKICPHANFQVYSIIFQLLPFFDSCDFIAHSMRSTRNNNPKFESCLRIIWSNFKRRKSRQLSHTGQEQKEKFEKSYFSWRNYVLMFPYCLAAKKILLL